jgi:hypothetical protein
MAAVSEIIVREFFELNGFFVRQQRKYIAAARREDDEIDFLIWNSRYRPDAEAPPFVLTTQDFAGISRAVVVVKGWHTETFSPGVLANAPEIFRFVEPPVFQQAARGFREDGPLVKMLVVPALPQNESARQASIELLRSKGVNAVIPFRTMLLDLIGQTEVNRNYQKSDLLQIIRILKNYDLFREPQLELFKARRGRKGGKRSTTSKRPERAEPSGATGT